MIELDGVSKAFGEGGARRVVLSAVSWRVPAGAFVAVTGPSGAGKSTLLHLVGGLDLADSGSVRVNGVVLGTNDVSRSAYRARSVGFVFQGSNLVPTLDVLANVRLPSVFGASIDDGRAREALERVGLAGFESRVPATLSGGEKQRVAIARAVASGAPLLLADEPTGNLDTDSGAAVISLLSELARGGTTVVVVTHEERVWRATSTTYRLDRGTLSEAA